MEHEKKEGKIITLECTLRFEAGIWNSLDHCYMEYWHVFGIGIAQLGEVGGNFGVS